MYQHSVCNALLGWYQGIQEAFSDNLMLKMTLRSADQSVKGALEGLDNEENRDKRRLIEERIIIEIFSNSPQRITRLDLVGQGKNVSCWRLSLV
jgi:GMP synthase PP-ATPase subunit